MVPLPAEIVEQRLSIFVIYANSILSAPEGVLESRNTKNSRLWGQRFAIESNLDTLETTITCPLSKQTVAKLLETNGWLVTTGERARSTEALESRSEQFMPAERLT
jgi:hypothetical protein